MKSIFEFAAKHIEPSLKRSLILKLLEKGTSRSYIASKLGISQSLITRYIKGERGLHDFTGIDSVNKALEELAERIMHGEIDEPRIYAEITRLTMYILSNKYACGIHYLATRDVNPATCNLCPTVFRTLVLNQEKSFMPRG